MACVAGLFLSVEKSSELVVDTARGEILRINVNVTFPALACSVVSLDAMDISGEQHLDVKHNIYKKRLDPTGLILDAPKPAKSCWRTSYMRLLRSGREHPCGVS